SRTVPRRHGGGECDDPPRYLHCAGPRRTHREEGSGRMNLTWHIVKKDFARLRLPLALWVVLILGQFLLSWQILHAVNPDPAALQLTLHTLDRMKDVLFGLQIFLCCLLVAALIHEDSLAG